MRYAVCIYSKFDDIEIDYVFPRKVKGQTRYYAYSTYMVPGKKLDSYSSGGPYMNEEAAVERTKQWIGSTPGRVYWFGKEGE